MRHYRLLVLGYPVITPHSAWSSAEMLTCGIATAFMGLPHVTLFAENIQNVEKRILPKVDFVLLTIYGADDAKVPFVMEQTGARKLAAFREVACTCDHSFVFKDVGWETEHTRLRLPCWKSLMRNFPKDGSILIDHSWDDFIGTEDDWTERIEGWLEPLSASRRIYRLARHKTDAERAAPYTVKLGYQHYTDYLAATSRIERFVLTHKECYPFGVIDMAARGTQVIAPCGFLPHSLVDELGIDVFHGQESLLNILGRPVPDTWNHKIDLMTDFTECARIIDWKFQEWLTTERPDNGG